MTQIWFGEFIQLRQLRLIKTYLLATTLMFLTFLGAER